MQKWAKCIAYIVCKVHANMSRCMKSRNPSAMWLIRPLTYAGFCDKEEVVSKDLNENRLTLSPLRWLHRWQQEWSHLKAVEYAQITEGLWFDKKCRLAQDSAKNQPGGTGR